MYILSPPPYFGGILRCIAHESHERIIADHMTYSQSRTTKVVR